MSMSSPPGGGGGAFGGPPGGFGGPPGGGPPGGGGAFGGPPGDPGGGYGPPPGGAPPGGGYGPPPGGAPPGGFGGPPPGGGPPGGAFGPPGGGPVAGGFGGPPPGDPGGGYGPPGGAPPGGAFGGPPPGGFGGAPPGDPGGYGPPPGGAPPGGAFGGPPGGAFGGPPPGGFGGPPQGGGFGGPMGAPPAKKGPPVGLLIGLGCGGLALIGIIITVVIFFSAKKAAEEIANAPELKSPSEKSPSIPGLPDTGNLKAELRDLREFKGAIGSTRHFVGEIHNTGSGSLGFPMAKVVLYDTANTAVESGTCMSVVRVLPAGEKVPCTFLVTGNKSWTSHKVEITPQRSFFNGQLAKLDITDVKFTPKKRVYGAHEIEGKITNQSTFMAKGVMVLVSLYDKAGKIVGATQVPVAGNNLATGTSARFEGKIFEVADTPDKWQVVAVGYSE